MILRKVEQLGQWPQGLLDVDIAFTPKVEGDSTHLGQRLCTPSSSLAVGLCSTGTYSNGFSNCVPDSVFCAGIVVSSVDASFSTSLENEEVLANAMQDVFHVFWSGCHQVFRHSCTGSPWALGGVSKGLHCTQQLLCMSIAVGILNT